MARPALSAARAVDVLNLLVSHADRTFTLSDLVRRLGVNLASMHAVLAVLERSGYVTRDERTRTYSLGPVLVPMGQAALARHAAVRSARDLLGRLAGELGVVGVVVGRTDAEMVVLDEIASPAPTSTVGQRIRMVPPMGAVFMAWAEAPAVDEWLARSPTPVRPADRDRYARWFAAIRDHGCAVGLETSARQELRRAVRQLREEPGSRSAAARLRHSIIELGDLATVVTELHPGLRYDVSHVAAPVFDADGAVSVSLYLMGLRRALSAYEVEHLGERLRAAAAAAGRQALETHAVDPLGDDDGLAVSRTAIW